MKTLQFWPIAWTLAVFAAVVFTLDMLLGVLFPNWWVMQKAYFASREAPKAAPTMTPASEHH